MKPFLTLAIAALFFMGVSSCSDADKVAGSWLGAPTRINIGGTADTQVTPRLTFVPGDKATEGAVTIDTDIAVLDVIPSNDSLVSPYEVSVVGTATIMGTYSFDDDDEIHISLDNSTLSVNIAPKDIRFDESQFTQRLIPEQMLAQKGRIARRYATRIQHTLGVEILQYSRLDDVKIDKDLLMCEINDRDVTFRSLTPRE